MPVPPLKNARTPSQECPYSPLKNARIFYFNLSTDVLFSYANLPSIRLKHCFVVSRYIEFLYCKKNPKNVFWAPDHRWCPVAGG